MVTEADLTRQYTDRALLLIRAANGLARDADKELRALATELRNLIAGAAVAGITKRELTDLLREIDRAVGAHYVLIAEGQAAAVAELVRIEAEFARRASAFQTAATETALTRAASNLLLFGTPLRDTWSAQQRDLSTRIAGILREASAGAIAPDAVLPMIFGEGPRGRESGGIINIGRRNADALVHTTVSEAATDARMAEWKAAGVNAFKWHAVLDGRTTPGCALRNGKLYDIETLKPIGHAIPIERKPPRHWRCRSLCLPMAYASDIPMPEDGGASTFADYFAKLPLDDQERLFGVGRADLFRRGVISQSDLVGQAGQFLTLAELRALTGR